MANTRVTTPVADFDKSTSLPGLKIPSGDNSNQPAGAAAEQGMIRNDTEEIVDSSDSAIAHYNGTAWQYFAATESADPNPSLIANTNLLLEAFNSSSYSGSGATWTDLSTEQDNATLYNISSNNNQYFDFNGSSQWAEGDSAITGQEYSVCMWINPDVNTTGSPFETSDANGTSGSGNRLFFSSGDFYATMNGGNNGYALVYASNFPVATWTFVCVVYSNTSLTIYKNNAVSLATASTSGSFVSTAKYRIGVNKNNGTNRQYFNGQISKVQTIQGVISTAQIQFLYGLGKGF